MLEKVIGLIYEVKEGSIEREKIDRKANMITDIGVDSLQLVNLILLVEEEFGIEIDFDLFDYSVLKSVEKFVDFIERQIEGE